METITKSNMVRKLTQVIEEGKDFKVEWIHKQTGKIITVSITIKDKEYFVDGEGVRWVRA
jgi:hypothetical protein